MTQDNSEILKMDIITKNGKLFIKNLLKPLTIKEVNRLMKLIKENLNDEESFHFGL